MPSDDVVLHALVIKGFGSTTAIAAACGVDEADVDAALAAMERDGLAKKREGRMSGWSPTPDARVRHRTLLDGPLAPADRAAALDVYSRFSALNGRFKQVCTDWQMRDGALNDHTDAAYDARVLIELGAVHEEAAALCEMLAPGLARVERYRARLADALAAVRAGDAERFTKPLNDSYHDIWMELHQDLLLTLGLERTADDA